MTQSLSDEGLDLGRGSIHGQIQHLLMEVRLSMQKMEQIQEASVIVIAPPVTYIQEQTARRGKS